jgi:hypothetical protein
MNKLDYDLNNIFLQNIDKKEKYNILFQSLITIYDMNNNYNIYFNDIYYDNILKNIMIKKIKNKIDKKILYYKLDDNNIINVKIDKYQVQFIDYGYIKTKPKLRTIEYTKKYFNNLYELNIYSEILLFTFIFLQNCDLSNLYNNNILNLLQELTKHILTITKSQKKFDTYLIMFIYKNINSILL